jgi:hypothetical protein
MQNLPISSVLIWKRTLHSARLNRKGSKKQNDAEMFNLFFCQSDDTRQGTACKGKKRAKLSFFEDFLRFARWKALAERFWPSSAPRKG